MDLHFTSDQPNDAERSAVDAVLGPARIEMVRRHQPGRIGSPDFRKRSSQFRPAPPAVARSPFHTRTGGVDQSRGSELRLPAAECAARRGLRGGRLLRHVLAVKAGSGRSSGLRRHCLPSKRGQRALLALEQRLGPAGEPRDGAGSTWARSPCLGLCERAPAVLVTGSGETAWNRVIALPAARPYPPAWITAIIRCATTTRWNPQCRRRETLRFGCSAASGRQVPRAWKLIGEAAA